MCARRDAAGVDVGQLLADLVATPSVNPSHGGTGEAAIASRVAEALRSIGLEPRVVEVKDGRPNVIATLRGTSPGPHLLLTAHLDTVALPPQGLDARRSAGRIEGRGASDTKASLAAMIAAMARLRRRPMPGTVTFAGVMDEEVAMAGSLALLDQMDRPDAALVGEPSSNRPARAHNGFARIRIVAQGRAAHTSKSFLGVNAIVTSARAIVGLEEELVPQLRRRTHPLVGAPTLTVAVIVGGTAPNLVPDRCEIVLDRRLSPGEEPSAMLAELDAVLAHATTGSAGELSREEPMVMLRGVETRPDHPLVIACEQAASASEGSRVVAGGVPYSTDACQLSGVGGIPCVVLGPGSIDQAHSADEWVDLPDVECAVDIYEAATRRFLGDPTG